MFVSLIRQVLVSLHQDPAGSWVKCEEIRSELSPSDDRKGSTKQIGSTGIGAENTGMKVRDSATSSRAKRQLFPLLRARGSF
jgi:hypothetical protein